MRRKQFTPEKVIGLLRQAEVELAQGKRVGEVCRILGISEQSYYRWRGEYGGLKLEQVALPHRVYQSQVSDAGVVIKLIGAVAPRELLRS